MRRTILDRLLRVVELHEAELHAGGKRVAAAHAVGFGNILTSGNAANDSDPDHDGISNLMEYALGLHPGVGNPPTSGLVTDREAIASSNFLRLSVTKNPLASDVVYSVEVTDDLSNPASWTTAGTVIESNTSNILIVRDTAPIGSTARHFMRLRVTQP